eukprot:CAMPEP_0168756638 /NCGR_PEP_ID=MMETSP0724-20121128/20724_1 /TAXON_ID=265536 /ORGANISM="Amphiprora sp., Strain CCMP467" /LENGTH=270 /DNA_ID=CAMNT_0008805363 /DNA_START=64 /DNA_END=876 /DNA_ORIENTATION=-
MLSLSLLRQGIFSAAAVVLLLEAAVTSSPCTEYDNPNSAVIPMVGPPVELVGIWNGSNCGLNDGAPVKADLTMDANGTNIWYFDGIPQTGSGVEAVVGWNCLPDGPPGVGYWWGQTQESDQYWCNLFQVTYDADSRQATYINYAFGGEGQFANAVGSCPTGLENIPANALQATFSRQLGETEAMEFTCQASVSSMEALSCQSQFEANNETIPNPLETSDGATLSLPIMDDTTCKALDSDSTSSSRITIRQTSWLGVAGMVIAFVTNTLYP